MRLSEKITFAREARGLKKKELADAIDRSPSAITQLESGDSKSLLVETEIALSRVLRVAREYFTSTENDWEKYRFENYRAEKFTSPADAAGQTGGEIGDSAPKPKPGEEGYIVSAKYNEAPESVKNTIDDLLSLPADQAEEIAATIQKLKGIYGSGGKA